MPLANAVLNPFLEKSLPKVIDARVHGIIDYCHASFFFGMAILCRRRNPRAATAALLAGSFVLVESLLTDYPLGIAKVIPFETHGRLDSAFAASSSLVPKLFGFNETGAAAIFEGNALVEATVVGMTDFSNESAQADR
ncbi:MAG TPA: hypothetical protein VGR96_00285 [Acidobacteriaceae bacterium]|nr:hypothetical protein [Acidobacteriaceae bacterium]